MIRIKNLKGALVCLDMIGAKPNYSDLGRQYGVDRRTAKKMYLGLINDNTNRNKTSKLDKYQDIIIQKLSIPGTTRKAVYEY